MRRSGGAWPVSWSQFSKNMRRPARADRVAEALQAAVGVHRQVALEVEGAVEHFLPGGAALGEAEVLVDEQLGRREAVVHLGHRDL